MIFSLKCYAAETAAENKHIENKFEDRLIEEMVTEYPESVIRFQKKIAERGSLTAQKLLGNYYKMLGNDSANLQEALKWYSMAADKNDKDAINQLMLIDVMLIGFSKVIHGEWYENIRNIEMPSSTIKALLGELSEARAYRLDRELQFKRPAMLKN